MEKSAKEMLETGKVIAVVGLSDNPERTSNRVARYMQERGYKIIPVNPNIKEALGEKAYASLRDIPQKIDIVNVFRRSEDIPPIADDAIAIKAGGLWMQEGIINQNAADKAEAAGLKVVMDSCIMVQHARLCQNRSE
jgi:predicted CoA-binding protein